MEEKPPSQTPDDSDPSAAPITPGHPDDFWAGKEFNKVAWGAIGLGAFSDRMTEFITWAWKSGAWKTLLFVAIIGGCVADRCDGIFYINDLKQKRSDLVETLGRKENEILKLTAELAPWKTMAGNIFTNEIPAKQLEKLLVEISRITTDMGRLGPAAYDFKLYMNGSPVSQGSIIRGTNSTIRFEVKNSGLVSASGLTVSFNSSFPVSLFETNVAALGWRVQGHAESTVAPVIRVPKFGVSSDNQIGAGEIFVCPPVDLLTNYTSPFALFSVSVLAAGSKTDTYLILFVPSH